MHIQKRQHFHTKTTSAKLYIHIGVEARDLYIDEAHTALNIFFLGHPLYVKLRTSHLCMKMLSFLYVHAWTSDNSIRGTLIGKIHSLLKEFHYVDPSVAKKPFYIEKEKIISI